MRLHFGLGVLAVIFFSDVLGDNLGTDSISSDTKKAKGTKTNSFKESLKKHRGSKAQEIDDELEYVREKLQKMAIRSKKRLILSKERQEELSSNLKKIRHRKNETTRGNRIEDINAVADPDGYLYEGDILLTREQVDALYEQQGLEEGNRTKRQAINVLYDPSQRWTNFPIPYTLSTSLSPLARNAISKGLKYWEANTCITFRENGAGTNSISFFPGNGCYSNVGRVASQNKQDLSIGNGCEWVDTVIHEVGHALGFFHTQSRHDRDEYVTIILGNVQADKQYNFDKQTATTNNNYGLPYDYGSVMHYSKDAFAINMNIPTIIPKDVEYLYTMGSGKDGSFYDVLMMNKLYGCLDICDGYTTECLNGGYKDPKNCAICKCPGGYGGNDCSRRARESECGETLSAQATYQQKTSVFVGPGAYSTPVLDEWLECTYWITAPQGKRIEVIITEITTSSCSAACYFGGVEFKTAKDQMLTGYRYCCQDDVNKMLTSETNRLPIIVLDRYYQTRFSMLYRYVDGSSTVATTAATTPAATTTAYCNNRVLTDTANSCAQNKVLCLNYLYKDLMTEQCAKTCGFCPGTNALPKVSGCADAVPYCVGNEAMCTSAYYTDTMKAVCAKTCKHCTDGVTPPACRDIASNCARNANLCENVYYKDLMKEQCVKTCNKC